MLPDDKGSAAAGQKCVVEDVILRKRGRVEPLLVEFANGKPVEGSALEGRLHHVVADSAGHWRKDDRALTISSPHMTYATLHNDQQGVDSQGGAGQCSLFLGVLNKSTGKLKLIEATSMCVQPQLDTISRGDEDSLHTKTFTERQEQMVTSFGSKKARQIFNRKKQYKVDEQNMSEAISQAAATVEAGEVDPSLLLDPETKAEESLLAVLPPCNREATQVEDVYLLEDIAPDYFLAEMEEAARAQLAEDAELPPECSKLFQDLHATVVREPKGDRQVRLMCVALYLEHLLAFLRLRDHEFRDVRGQKQCLPDCPRQVKFYIFGEYTQLQGNQRVRTKPDLDRAICCVLVLALIAHRYRLSLDTLLQSISIKRDRLKLLMRVVGATYNNSTQTFTLKLPLSKPAKPMKAKKKNNLKK